MALTVKRKRWVPVMGNTKVQAEQSQRQTLNVLWSSFKNRTKGKGVVIISGRKRVISTLES